MASLNNCSITGNLTRDPELRQTGSGKSVCNFRVAVNGFKEGDTEFFDVAAWGRRGEVVAEHLGRGSKVAVTGRVGLRTWDKPDGGQGATLVLTANDVHFIGTKADNQGGGQAPPAQRPATPAAAPASTPDDDDIPF